MSDLPQINFVNSEKKKPIVPKSFYYWYKNKLIVRGFPKASSIENFDVVINVSHEFSSEVHAYCVEHKKQYFWFPMSEINSNIGLNSIYGALNILKICEEKKYRVLLHCHAGANRSPSVKESYFVMRTHKEFSEKLTPRLMFNIKFGHLPSFYEYYYFLKDVSDDKDLSLDKCIYRAINHK